MSKSIEIKPIGQCFTCFEEKLLIPRQSGLVPSSFGHIELQSPFNKIEALKGLDSFSHLIITWISDSKIKDNKLTVRPPRLGGNSSLGVFATRSPFRPNPICSSIVKMERINDGKIYFSNHDILNETLIIDIKPYIPTWDVFDSALNGWIEDHPEEKMVVNFESQVVISDKMKNLITECLQLNPLPRYKIGSDQYGVKIGGYEVKFRSTPVEGFLVTNALKLPKN